jgi:sugar phosphate isomerase/epimerase
MKIGLLTAVLNDMPLEGVLDLARGAGYQAVEIGAWPWSKHLDLKRILAGDAGRVRDLVRARDLEISALSCHVNHAPPDPSEREKLNAHFALVLKAAALLGVKVVTALTAVAVRGEEESTWKEFRAVMAGHLALAQDLGLGIAIETFHPFLAHNVPTIERLFNELPQKNIGLNLDPSHFLWQHVDVLEVVRRFASKILHTHAKDTEILPQALRLVGVMGRDWWRFRVPGAGAVDWKTLLAAYRQISYDGVMSFEHEDPLIGAEEGVKAAAAFLRGLLDRP